MDLMDPQQMNGYAYANSAPVTSADPSGLFTETGCASCDKKRSSTHNQATNGLDRIVTEIGNIDLSGTSNDDPGPDRYIYQGGADGNKPWEDTLPTPTWRESFHSMIDAITFKALRSDCFGGGDREACTWDVIMTTMTAAIPAGKLATVSRTATAGERVAATAGRSTAADSAAKGGVYTLRDDAGNVVRTGRTKDLTARESAHHNDSVLGDYHFNVEYRTDVYAEQRGLEQILHDRYPGAQAANGGFNKIRGISPSNPNVDFYMQSGADFLARMGLG